VATGCLLSSVHGSGTSRSIHSSNRSISDIQTTDKAHFLVQGLRLLLYALFTCLLSCGTEAGNVSCHMIQFICDDLQMYRSCF